MQERYSELEGALRQLANLGGEPAVRRVLTGSTTACVRSWQVTECLRRLGVASRGAIEPARPSGTTTVLRAHGRFPSAAGQVEWIELARQPGSGPRMGDYVNRIATLRSAVAATQAATAIAELAALRNNGLKPRATSSPRSETWLERTLTREPGDAR